MSEEPQNESLVKSDPMTSDNQSPESRPQPVLGPKPDRPETLEWESEEGRAERANLCAKAISDAMAKYECILTVPTVDISTGRFIPVPKIEPAPRKIEPSRIVTPETIPMPRVLKRS